MMSCVVLVSYVPLSLAAGLYTRFSLLVHSRRRLYARIKSIVARASKYVLQVLLMDSCVMMRMAESCPDQREALQSRRRFLKTHEHSPIR